MASRTIFAAGFLALVAGTASAQVHRSVHERAPLEALEQNVEDISSLGVSLRSFQTDLRLPSGFESVYRLPDDTYGRQRLMRMDGALVATFPRSAYQDLYVRERFLLFLQRDRKVGVVPEVPAGTVFHIGMPQSHDVAGMERDGNHQARQQPQALLSAEPAVQRIEAIPADDHPAGVNEPRVNRAARRAEGKVLSGAPEEDVDGTAEPFGRLIGEERLREMLRRAVDQERRAAESQ